MSYTTFKYGKAKVNKKEMQAGETLTVTVPITNTGKREGAEVVQLYIRDEKSSLPRPVKELKGPCKRIERILQSQTDTWRNSGSDFHYRRKSTKFLR